ncbi:MAG: FkbM family methyltransferase [Verrucomicrobia bacterium]|nr:FkbM family methyltransferase [Verrucomicrobiota bacterium]
MLKYPPLVRELHDVLRARQFPALPEQPGRIELLARLLDTSISEAMYVVAELHATLSDPGDICEFGVAQGATSALLANEIRATNKQLWLYDSFAGLPKPSPQDQLKDDIFGLGSMDRYEGQMRCDAAEVETRLAQIGFPAARYHVRAGLVDQTLREGEGPATVCFADVDFDFYAPIAHTLAYLDRHLSPNGRIVVDDYDFFSTGAKTAVDEFLQQHGGRYEFVRPPAFAGKFCVLRRIFAPEKSDLNVRAPAENHWQQPTLTGFLERLGRYRIGFATVIDVGASNGMWTREVIQRFPEKHYFLVEARREHEPALAAFAAENPRVRYAICAAADRPGEVHFHAGDLFGGLAAHAPFSEHDIVVPARTLDELAATHQLKPPFLLKLDTHGFEEQILAGAPTLLAQASLVVIEAYNHRMGFGNLLFNELCTFMAQRGFRSLDLFDPLYRPHDASFWQVDFAFARSDWHGFSHPSYL